MDLALSDHVALVTGASGGIGWAVARAFAGEGARVVLLGHRSFQALRDRVATQPWSDRALCLRADVTRPADLERALQEAGERWGRVDHAVASAGIWPPEDLRLDQLPVERLRRTVEVDLLGAAWTARAWMAHLGRVGPRADGEGGSLVFIGSTAGRFGERGHADYAASKAALRGLVLSLEDEVTDLDPWARVNMVEPGWTATPMAETELRRPGLVSRAIRTAPLRQVARPDDIARLVVVLCSPAVSSHVTGEVITVAGGMEGRVRWEAGEIDEDEVRARLER